MTDQQILSLQDQRVQSAIELIWHEADLLDRKEYVEWQELYAADGLYVIPVLRDVEDFENHLNMVFDDDRMRRMRVTRMVEGYAIAAVDAATTIRTVSRFRADEVSDESVTIRSAQVIVAHKRGDHHLWAGEVTHEIRLTGERPTITKKVVRLIDSEDTVPASGFLL